jgi:hypothetical protein
MKRADMIRREIARAMSFEECIVVGCSQEYGHEGKHDQRLRDAAPIVAAMRDVPEERRVDAVATAVDVFCQTGGGPRIEGRVCGGCLAKARGETPRKPLRKPTRKELERVMTFLGVTWNGDRHVPVYGDKKRTR